MEASSTGGPSRPAGAQLTLHPPPFLKHITPLKQRTSLADVAGTAFPPPAPIRPLLAAARALTFWPARTQASSSSSSPRYLRGTGSCVFLGDCFGGAITCVFCGLCQHQRQTSPTSPIYTNTHPTTTTTTTITKHPTTQTHPLQLLQLPLLPPARRGEAQGPLAPLDELRHVRLKVEGLAAPALAPLLPLVLLGGVVGWSCQSGKEG